PGAPPARPNFPHADPPAHLAVIQAVREIAESRRKSVAILQDLQGPKIRTGRLREAQVELREGSRGVIATDETIEGDAGLISTTYDPLPRDVEPGDRILLDDGNLELAVVAVRGQEVETTVVHGGVLRPNKGMNLPGARLSTPALTEKDRRDLAFGVK